MDTTQNLKDAISHLKSGDIIVKDEDGTEFWFQSIVCPEQVVKVWFEQDGTRKAQRMSFEEFEETYFGEEFKF